MLYVVFLFVFSYDYLISGVRCTGLALLKHFMYYERLLNECDYLTYQTITDLYTIDCYYMFTDLSEVFTELAELYVMN